jgi:hypothetical protein
MILSVKEAQWLNEETFRGKLSRLIAYTWFVIAAYVVFDTVRRDEGRSLWIALSVVLLATVVAYALAFRPALVVNDNGLLIRNIVRDVEIPWPRVRGVESIWSLSVETDQDKYVVWAVNAGNPHRAKAMRDSPLTAFGRLGRNVADDVDVFKSANLVSRSVYARWETRRNDAPDGPVVVTVVWPVVAGLVVGAVAVLLAFWLG